MVTSPQQAGMYQNLIDPYEHLADAVFNFTWARQTQGPPTEELSSSDIYNFFHLYLGKNEQLSSLFGTDYINWGDANGDHLLNRSGKCF